MAGVANEPEDNDDGVSGEYGIDGELPFICGVPPMVLAAQPPLAMVAAIFTPPLPVLPFR